MVICGNRKQITGSRHFNLLLLFILQYSYYANILDVIGSAVRSVLAFHQFEPGLNVSNPGGDAIYVWVWKSMTMLKTVNILLTRMHRAFGALMEPRFEPKRTKGLHLNFLINL